MGVSRSPFELAMKFAAAAEGVDSASRGAAFEAGMTAKAIFEEEGQRARIPSQMRWGARFRDVADGGFVVWYYGAAAYWTEYGTGSKNRYVSPRSRALRRSYAIVPKSSSYRWRRERMAAGSVFVSAFTGSDVAATKTGGTGGQALKFPDGNFRTFVMHPGARPRPFWQGTKARAAKGAELTYRAAHKRNLWQSFAG
jgi:hypothetical protein